MHFTIVCLVRTVVSIVLTTNHKQTTKGSNTKKNPGEIWRETPWQFQLAPIWNRLTARLCRNSLTIPACTTACSPCQMRNSVERDEFLYKKSCFALIGRTSIRSRKYLGVHDFVLTRTTSWAWLSPASCCSGYQLQLQPASPSLRNGGATHRITGTVLLRGEGFHSIRLKQLHFQTWE